MAEEVEAVSDKFIVSERLPLSDMFNFEIKKYVPYIVITVILLISFIPTYKLKKFRETILSTLKIFVGFIFPPIFFYVMQGLSKFTIVLMAFSCLILATIVIIQLISICTKVPKHKRIQAILIVNMTLFILIVFIFPPLFSYAIDGISKLTIVIAAFDWTIIATIIITFLISRDESRKKIAMITYAILFSLTLIIYPPIFLYAAESFNSVTITFLILFESFVFTMILAFIASYFEVHTFGSCCVIICSLIVLSMSIYGLVIAIKSGLSKFIIITIIVNSIVGSCLACLKGTIVGKIAAYILVSIDFYILFYSMQSKINPISLLLFWSDLWAILFAIYVTIEKCIRGEDDDEEQEGAEFNLQNYIR